MNAKNSIQTHAHTQIGYPRWPEPPTDRIARERPKVESLAKDRQIQIEVQRVKDQLRIELQSKRFSIDRITRMEKIRIRRDTIDGSSKVGVSQIH
jgi:hypothetical protein